MNLKRSILFLAISAILYLAGVSDSSAKADLSLLVTDISFSKDSATALSGEKIRVFARVFNVGDEDVYGFVVFTLNGRTIGEPQAISVKVGTYDDVFIDWIFEKGNFAVGAKIVGTIPQDKNIDNNAVIHENYFVDSDSDGDGLIDEKELALGTNPSNSDTDNDGVSDKEEISLSTNPLNPDTDSDGLTDKEEISLGIDPLNSDTDSDGVGDKEELALGTNPLKVDSDGDLIPDKTEIKIGFLNPNRNELNITGNYLASAIGAIKMAVEQGNTQVGYLFAAFGFLSIIFLAAGFLQKR